MAKLKWNSQEVRLSAECFGELKLLKVWWALQIKVGCGIAAVSLLVLVLICTWCFMDQSDVSNWTTALREQKAAPDSLICCCVSEYCKCFNFLLCNFPQFENSAYCVKNNANTILLILRITVTVYKTSDSLGV